MSTQVFLASTAFGLATLVAALDADLISPAPRRILVVANNTLVPEGADSLRDVGGTATLLARFETVYDYNEAIEPQHPAAWSPRATDLPLWERHFRRLWELGADEVELIVESIQVDPALALCRLFADASIVVYADGLMSYGPTRRALPETLGGRVRRLLYLDLVPGVTPLLLSEWGVESAVIPPARFAAVIEGLGLRRPAARAGTDARPIMVLGQYLTALGVLTESEELALNADLVLRCSATSTVAAPKAPVVFKPHPSAPASAVHALRRLTDDLGVGLWVADGAELAETWFAAGRISAVASCFSTGLLTARSVYGLPVARLGTELLLERLTPYHNSNRIPVTVVDALLPELPLSGFPVAADAAPTAGLGDLAGLVAAVGYAMQPNLLGARRVAAAAYLDQHPDQRRRYVKRRRLTRLNLPGALPRRSAPPWWRRVAALRRNAQPAARRP